jgi:DNA (cytosine-5)-methyltransferase 1
VKKILAADLFCGAGGASTGFIRACELLGIDYELLAINHWQTAVDTHSANHPHVRHLCESVERVDPVVAVPGGRLHLLLAGPECTHFSTARGGRPVNPQSRASAWHILKWAQELYIDTILIENVPEFRTWGPVGTNGKPLKSKRGETYRAFLEALRSLGYKVEDRVLNSADYGDPTTRKRLFIMARRGRHQIAWPAPTHSKTGGSTLFGPTKRWRAAREVIDWAIAGKSIFNRKRPLKPATIARILAGLEKFGGEELKPFLVVLRNHADGRSVDGPLPTLSAQGQHVGVAQPFLVPMYGERDGQQPRVHSVDAPVPTVPATGSGKFGVVESFVLPQHGGGALRPADQPLPTIATDGAIAVVEPFIVPPLRFDPMRVESVDEPLPTITATGGRLFGLAQPFLVPFYTERPEEKHARSRSVDDPIPTITGSGSGKLGVVEPFLTKYNRTATGAYSVNAPVDTISTRDRFGLVEPFLVGYHSERAGERKRVHDIDEPLPTQSTENRYALVQPVINGYVLDIHFRMLQTHELAAATSFPKTYVFTGTREDVVKQIGNSWTGELSFQLNVAAIQDYAPARKHRIEAIA